MNTKFQFSSAMRWVSACAFSSCLLANVALRAQETKTFSFGHAAASGGGTNILFHTAHGAGAGAFFINGFDIGTILLKACDLDQDAKVTLAEFKQVAAASFKLWDANNDGTVSSNELSVALKEFFPGPPPGAVHAMHAMRLVNGVAVEVPPGELLTPDAMVTKGILSGADSNKDGLLTAQEVDDFIQKNFGQWDADSNGSLEAQEFGAAFGQLAVPDEISTSAGH